MAELILTDEEKQAASYLDWSDEALGKLVRSIAIDLKTDKASINASSLAVLLVGFVAESGSNKASFKLGEVSHKGEVLGDWIIKVEKNA